MRKILICALILSISLVAVNKGIAQKSLKFGHIDFQALLQLMPERNLAQNELKKYAQTLQDQAEEMQVEYNKKIKTFQESNDSLPKLVRENKIAEIQELEKRIQQFQGSAQQDLQNKEKELLEPIIQKAQKAIRDVAKENGFIYIFESSGLHYFSEDSQDVVAMVQAKLNIKETPKEETKKDQKKEQPKEVKNTNKK
jgi:outer membrane protein